MKRNMAALVDLAKERLAKGQLTAAQSAIGKALHIDPKSVFALQLAGAIASELGKKTEAVRLLQRAAQLAPSSFGVHFNLGKALHLAGRVNESLDAYSVALALRSDVPDVHLAYGSALLTAQKLEEAEARLREAIRLNPESVDAYYNIAQVFEGLRNPEAAAAAWGNVVRRDPESAEAKFFMGRCLQELCYWKGFDQRLSALRSEINEGHTSRGTAFYALWFWDEPRIHRQSAELETVLNKAAVPAKFTRRKRLEPCEQIRVAYISADFRKHAVSKLMSGLFEAHDRKRFTTTAVALTEGDGSHERQRVEKFADVFMDVHEDQNEVIASTLRRQEIDIAVDLTGYTGNARPSIFAHRAAPIQVNYLGYPSTTGLPAMDYIIVDPFIASGEVREHASEKLVLLPDCYQCNDRSRPKVVEIPSRSDCELPEDGFVFASFNQQSKITPSVFDVWMRILRKVDRGVLWLLVYVEKARDNLRTEAKARGVDPSRLVFAKNAPHEQHIARLALADLQLDTFPYNAHTTASDSLWAGSPILTLAGRSFPSRVCGSILTTIGLPDLIASSWEEYENMAVRLAQNRNALDKFKARVAVGRENSPLFDISRYCRNLERAYEEMVAIAASGRPPAEIDVRRLI
jgi:predicted O-linked N-acetylglucosamine transferase (SPINDLY family)